MMNLNNVTKTATHFIDRDDVTNAPAELITAAPFKLTVTNPKFENVATQDITGTDAEGRTILCTRKGWKQGFLGIKWDNWKVEYITKKGEAMNVKAMTDAEIEMNISRLQTEQMERAIKRVVGEVNQRAPAEEMLVKLVDGAIAKATTKPKPEPSPVSDMVVIINNVPHPLKKVDALKAWHKLNGIPTVQELVDSLAKLLPSERVQEFKRPEPVEFTIKMANEQEFNELMAEIAEQDAGRIMPIPPLSEEGIEKATAEAMDWVEQVERRNAHLMECEDCRKEHTAKLNQSLIELDSLIDTQTKPRLLEILKEQRDGLQRELTKFLAM